MEAEVFATLKLKLNPELVVAVVVDVKLDCDVKPKPLVNVGFGATEVAAGEPKMDGCCAAKVLVDS